MEEAIAWIRKYLIDPSTSNWLEVESIIGIKEIKFISNLIQIKNQLLELNIMRIDEKREKRNNKLYGRNLKIIKKKKG